MMDKYILISIHDVNPVYDKEIFLFLDALKKRGIKEFSMLITPSYEGIKTNNDFARRIKGFRGAELILHGYDHYDGRYIYSDERKILSQINKGMKEFMKYYKIIPNGYIPPVWKSSKKLNAVLKKKFRYTEDFSRIIFFKRGFVIKSFPLGMESMSNNKYFNHDKATPLITRFLSNVYARISNARVIRYTLHPREATNGNFDATLKLLDIMIMRGFKPITYTELEKVL